MNEFERIEKEVLRLKVESGRMVAILANPEYAERLIIAEKEHVEKHGIPEYVNGIELRIEEEQEEDYKMILL